MMMITNHNYDDDDDNNNENANNDDYKDDMLRKTHNSLVSAGSSPGTLVRPRLRQSTVPNQQISFLLLRYNCIMVVTYFSSIGIQLSYGCHIFLIQLAYNCHMVVI